MNRLEKLIKEFNAGNPLFNNIRDAYDAWLNSLRSGSTDEEDLGKKFSELMNNSLHIGSTIQGDGNKKQMTDILSMMQLSFVMKKPIDEISDSFIDEMSQFFGIRLLSPVYTEEELRDKKENSKKFKRILWDHRKEAVIFLANFKIKLPAQWTEVLGKAEDIELQERTYGGQQFYKISEELNYHMAQKGAFKDTEEILIKKLSTGLNNKRSIEQLLAHINFIRVQESLPKIDYPTTPLEQDKKILTNFVKEMLNLAKDEKFTTASRHRWHLDKEACENKDKKVIDKVKTTRKEKEAKDELQKESKIQDNAIQAYLKDLKNKIENENFKVGDYFLFKGGKDITIVGEDGAHHKKRVPHRVKAIYDLLVSLDLGNDGQKRVDDYWAEQLDQVQSFADEALNSPRRGQKETSRAFYQEIRTKTIPDLKKEYGKVESQPAASANQAPSAG